MGGKDKPARGPGEGGVFWRMAYRYLAGPAETQGAVQGGSAQAREQWKRDLENRKRYSREQRELKRAAREAARRDQQGL